MIRSAATALSLTLASQALAGDFLLHSPIACALGEDRRCYIQHYVDRDPGPGRRDFMCRETLTYDTHGGTDFALRSLAEMEAGVEVIAAAPGTVRGVRDGMADRVFDPDRDTAALDGRDCGNGVVIAHEGGWETQYCHLREGSVAVRPGQSIAIGDTLGLVGMSGRAQFPHLHLHVRRGNAVIDPFAPDRAAQCGTATATLFQDPPTYQPGGLIAAGFAPAVPAYDAIKAGDAHAASLPETAPALVLWGFAFGTEPGDALRLTITGPEGDRVFTTDAEFDRGQAQAFRAGGRRTQGAEWFTPGTYTGTVALIRDGAPISDMETQVTVTSR